MVSIADLKSRRIRLEHQLRYYREFVAKHGFDAFGNEHSQEQIAAICNNISTELIKINGK